MSASLGIIFAMTTLVLLVIVIYLLDGWKNSVERRFLALEKAVDALVEELRFLRK